MDIGLHAAMLEARYPLVEALAKAAELGAQSYEIDVGIGHPGEPWKNRFEAWRRDVQTVRETAEQAAIKLPSICLGVLWQYSLASPDEAERAQGVRVIQDCCELAEALGAGALLIPVGQPPGLAPEMGRANVVDSLSRCLETAQNAGVTLALENVCQEVLKTAEALLEVVGALHSPHCGVYYDLGNSSFVGLDPVQELRTLAPQLTRVHLKDTVPVRRERAPIPVTPITGDFTVWQRCTTVTLGSGRVDFAALRRILSEAEYTAGLIIEVPQPATEVERGCRTNLEAAQRLFGVF